MLGALPSRMASRSTGSASPSISRKTIPGTAVASTTPWRRAMRRVTRKVNSSSSLVPNSTSRTTDAAQMMSEAASAAPNESTCTSPGTMSLASFSTNASSRRTRRNPRRSVNGSRSAATTGGRSALSTPMIAATTKAEPVRSSSTPDRTDAATATAAAVTIHARIRCSGRSRGVSGFQSVLPPYAPAPAMSPAQALSDEDPLLRGELLVGQRAGVVQRRQPLELGHRVGHRLARVVAAVAVGRPVRAEDRPAGARRAGRQRRPRPLDRRVRELERGLAAQDLRPEDDEGDHDQHRDGHLRGGDRSPRDDQQDDRADDAVGHAGALAQPRRDRAAEGDGGALRAGEPRAEDDRDAADDHRLRDVLEDPCADRPHVLGRRPDRIGGRQRVDDVVAEHTA